MRKPAVVAGRHQNHFHRFGACGTPVSPLAVVPGNHADAKRPSDAMKTRLPIFAPLASD